MEALGLALWIGVSLIGIVTTQHSDDLVSIINRMDDINEEVLQSKSDVIRVEEKLLHQIDVTKISLRLELKQHISVHVREALTELLQGESVEEMVRSQVITEVRQLKRGNHQMKRQLRRFMLSLKYVQEEGKRYKELLQKVESNVGQTTMCSKPFAVVESLKRDLEKCHQNENMRKKENVELRRSMDMLNQTCTSQIQELSSVSEHEYEVTTRPHIQVTSTVATTSHATTTKPEDKISRILVAPIWSSTQQKFRQLNLDTNAVGTYQYLNLKLVGCLVYVSKLRKLVIGLENPKKLIFSSLDGYDVKTLRENVEATVMNVDEEREVIFMGTYAPYYTISRMTTQGKHFTVLTDVRSYGSYPKAIAVNSKEEKIYVCNGDTLFMVRYDGRMLQILATGSDMNGVTLDKTGTFMYYSHGKILKKLSLSQNVSSNVSTLGVIPWNLLYYNNTVYFSSKGSSTCIIGAVDIGYNAISYVLQRISMTGANKYSIIFLP